MCVELADDVVTAPTSTNTRGAGPETVIFCKLTMDNIKGSKPIPSYTSCLELFSKKLSKKLEI